MHEWALAEAIISSVLRAARDAGASGVKAVEIAVGELQGLDEEAMMLALQELSNRTSLRDARWSFFRVRGEFRCRACEAEWDMDRVRRELDREKTEAIHFVPELVHAFIRCPSCGSPDFEIRKGRGVWVERIKAST